MKNLIIKTGSLLALTIILTVVSAQAQSIKSYQARIPFDFMIGNKTYKAGDYVVSIKSPFTLDARLTIRNSKNRDSREMAVLTNGSRSLVDKTVLMFDRYDNQYILTQMVSTDFGLSAPRSKIKKRTNAKNLRQPEESVAIVLAKQDKNGD